MNERIKSATKKIHEGLIDISQDPKKTEQLIDLNGLGTDFISKAISNAVQVEVFKAESEMIAKQMQQVNALRETLLEKIHQLAIFYHRNAFGDEMRSPNRDNTIDEIYFSFETHVSLLTSCLETDETVFTRFHFTEGDLSTMVLDDDESVYTLPMNIAPIDLVYNFYKYLVNECDTEIYE